MSSANPTYPQMWRQMRIREWLLRGRRFNSTQASMELEVSRRTIAQDIECLRALGHDIEYDARTRSYRLGEITGELPALQLRRSELAAIMLASEIFQTIGAQPMAAAVDRIVTRVRELVPDIMGIEHSAFKPALTVTHGPAPERPLPFLMELSQAVEENRSIEIEYFTMYRNVTSVRMVDPYRLLSRDGRGYLIAWCHNRENVLMFRLDRIQKLSHTDRFFSVVNEFSSENFLGPMFGVFRDSETYRIKVRFSRWVARWIREDVWHPSQQMTDLPDGSLQVDMDVTGIVDVKRWILSFGADAEVVEPEFLRHEIAEEVQRMGFNLADRH